MPTVHDQSWEANRVRAIEKAGRDVARYTEALLEVRNRRTLDADYGHGGVFEESERLLLQICREEERVLDLLKKIVAERLERALADQGIALVEARVRAKE